MIWKRRRIRENLYPAAATIECTLREHSIVMNKKAVCFGRHRKMLCRTHGFFCRIGNFVSIRQKNSARMCQGTFFFMWLSMEEQKEGRQVCSCRLVWKRSISEKVFLYLCSYHTSQMWQESDRKMKTLWTVYVQKNNRETDCSEAAKKSCRKLSRC